MAKDTDYKTEVKEEFRKVNKKSGEVETWYRIFATSKGGTYFHVEVPAARINEADAFLTSRAKALDAV